MDAISEDKKLVQAWWSTNIIQMSPGVINFRGYKIEELIGNVSFVAMIWLMLKGNLPNKEEEYLLNAALMSGVDHGPQAPSIAISRMAITCGIGINNAMASAINVLGDVHGGAGEQCLALFLEIYKMNQKGLDLRQCVDSVLDDFFSSGQKYFPGFGHRFHPVDPRVKPLLELLNKTPLQESKNALFYEIALTLQIALQQRKNKNIPMNVDGATAAIYGALGFEPKLCRGLFILSRSVGILAHAWEQSQEKQRNKGPMPKGWLWDYTGPVIKE